MAISINSIANTKALYSLVTPFALLAIFTQNNNVWMKCRLLLIAVNGQDCFHCMRIENTASSNIQKFEPKGIIACSWCNVGIAIVYCVPFLPFYPTYTTGLQYVIVSNVCGMYAPPHKPYLALYIATYLLCNYASNRLFKTHYTTLTWDSSSCCQR